MRIKPTFSLKEIAGDFVVISTGSSLVDLTGSYSLNETAATLWRALKTENTREGLILALTAEYDVSEEEAAADTDAFLAYLAERDMLA